MFIKFICVAFFIFLLAVEASAQSPQVPPVQEPDSPAKVEQTGDEEQGNTETPSPPVPELETKPVEKPADSDSQESTIEVTTMIVPSSGQENDFVFWVAVFTFVLAAATIGLLGASVKQSGHIKDSIDIGEKNAKAFQNLMAKQMRAYLTVEPGILVPYDPEKGKAFEAILEIKNAGNTPASEIETQTAVGIFPLFLAGDFKFPEIPKRPSGQAVIAPGVGRGMHIIMDRQPTAEEVSEIYANKSVIYAYGEIIYKDFTKKKTRTTKFALLFIWQPEQKTFTPLYCPIHNEAD